MTNNLWKKIWRDHSVEIPWSEAVVNGAETGKAVLEMANFVQENQKLAEFAPLIGKISSLLDVLNLPMVQFLSPTLTFVPLGLKLLQSLSDNKQDPNMEACVAIIATTAYLDSYRQYIKMYEASNLSTINLNQTASATITKKLTEIGVNTKFSQKEAEDVLYQKC
jgi:hypothetical protein